MIICVLIINGMNLVSKSLIGKDRYKINNKVSGDENLNFIILK